MFCTNCGNKRNNEEKFCINCGTKFIFENTLNYNQTNFSNTKTTILDKKTEKNNLTKARQAIGFNYFIIIILLIFLRSIIYNLLSIDDASVKNNIDFCLYILFPWISVFISKILNKEKIKLYVTKENYEKVRNYSIVELSIFGLIYTGISFNSAFILGLIGYSTSVIYLLKDVKKIVDEKHL